jgi:hypothetical protein
MNQYKIREHTNTKVDYRKFALKPIVASLVMGGMIFIIFAALNQLIGQLLKNEILVSDICVIITAVLGIAIYASMLILLKAITTADIIKLPFGTKIEKYLCKVGIFRERLAGDR